MKIRNVFSKSVLYCTVLTVLLRLFAGHAAAMEGTVLKAGVEGGEIKTDTTWHGKMRVEGGTLVVHPGATLTIAPGTTVRFAKDSGLMVRGKIIAKGMPDALITFTSIDKKKPGAWGEVALESASGSIISNCVFEYGKWGLHIHFTHVEVKNCRFRNIKLGGLRFMSGFPEIRDNVFEDNELGIRMRIASGIIERNIITRNKHGIYVKERTIKLKIKNNNIFANEYNLSIGAAVLEDVAAQENWWGPGDPVEKFFDGRREPGIGKVNYEPYLKERVKTALHETK